jgi:transcriptional regulator with XRE-family HTH domain
MARSKGLDRTADPGAFLGDELGRLRLAAGFETHQALAKEIQVDVSVIWKAEQGRRPPTDNVLKKWLDTCQVSGPLRDLLERLVVLARNADRSIPAWFENWLEIEALAHTLRLWQPLIIPGPLQTAGYARELFLAQEVEGDKLEEMVTARLARQAPFERTDPPHVIVVLDEAVLYRQIGAPAIMADVVAHVAVLSERSNMSIHVLPVENGANAALFGSFSIASVDGRADVLVMDAVQDQTTDDRSLIRRAAVAFDLVRRDALPRAASRTRILEAADKWKTH